MSSASRAGAAIDRLAAAAARATHAGRASDGQPSAGVPVNATSAPPRRPETLAATVTYAAQCSTRATLANRLAMTAASTASPDSATAHGPGDSTTLVPVSVSTSASVA